MVQMVQRLPSKYKTLSSKGNTAGKKRKITASGFGGFLSRCMFLGPVPLGSLLFLLHPSLLLCFCLSPDLDYAAGASACILVCLSTVCPAGWKPGSDTIKPNVDDSKEYFSKHN
jgi:hypothetical protein